MHDINQSLCVLRCRSVYAFENWWIALGAAPLRLRARPSPVCCLLALWTGCCALSAALLEITTLLLQHLMVVCAHLTLVRAVAAGSSAPTAPSAAAHNGAALATVEPLEIKYI